MPRPERRQRNHVVQEQHRHGHPVRGDRAADLRESETKGHRRRAAARSLHDASRRQALFAVTLIFNENRRKKSAMKRLLLLASFFYFVLTSAAMATDPAIVEGAKKEGALIFYTTM